MIIAAPADGLFSCPQYKCKVANLGDGICIYTYNQVRNDSTGANYTTTVSEIDTSVCQKGISVCLPTQVDGKHVCALVADGQNVDGEKCTNNTKCFSLNCNGGVCKGIDNSAACDDTNQCKIGYYCTGNNRTDPNSTCQPQVAANAACKLRFDCVNNNDCIDSKCVPAFSLADATPFSVGMQAHSCQSGYAYGGFCTQYRYLGTKGDYITNGTDNKCVYNFTAQNQTIPHPEGQCAVDGTFNKYCYHPGTDSDLFQDQNTKLKNYYNGPALSKHSIRRDSYSDDIVLALAKVSAWPKLNNADKCTISLFTQTSSASFAKLSALVFGVLFLLF